ncbi:formate dehydrogenase accessory sulfurtransferase FdhD [Pseudorhodoferax sp. Leaf267]|uniref:formate dehydrogenase accessory sulfurtransferase FdhD n=1 Tax=Pseudorhodoferax sp. Leaf267 TaxID=1736316 RepID=UPI0006F58A89|nr:formate dehydrogenase accessory sulfurtransferase FdhD [Pseudorhodoferax sp. Leaf267]KQP21931.1 formate dehydrogenase family accessory protein FdhD [Pseudorhodoferax sp. Leaf267]
MKPADAPVSLPAGTRRVTVTRGSGRAADDAVVDEVPIALEYNGISHAVMLATPLDLEDFALGFSLTEEIVDSRADVRDLEVVDGCGGLTVQLEIASACFARLKDKRRSLAGRTGCGLCGAESLPQAVKRPAPLHSDARFGAASVSRAMRALDGLQPLRAVTGATHAAGFADAQGQVLLVREDVGRHNALDKLVGAMLTAGHVPQDGFIVVTSRASYEMAGKTVRAGSALLAAVSGVTGLAIELAQDAHLTLIGFARGETLSVYTHPERIVWTPPT